MKRTLLAVVLAVFIAVLSLFGRSVVRTNTEAVDGLLASAYDSALHGDFIAAANYAERAEQRFVDCEEYVSMFIDSRLIDDFGVSISRLSRLADEDTAAEFLAECAAAHVMLTHIADGDRPILTNIL